MVAVPILPDFSGEELDQIITHSEAKALLVSDKLFSKLSKRTVESLSVVMRTKNLGVISQHVRTEGRHGGAGTRRPGGHHLHFGHHVATQRG